MISSTLFLPDSAQEQSKPFDVPYFWVRLKNLRRVLLPSSYFSVCLSACLPALIPVCYQTDFVKIATDGRS
jgi:hypothetical protein